MIDDISGHLPYATLADLAEGRLAANAYIQAHLASCTACSAELAWIERVIRLMRDSRELPSSPEAVDRAKGLFLQHRGAAIAQPLQRLLAELRFDSARGAAVFGVRGAAQAERQLLYRSGSYDVELHIGRSGKLWAVSGQVFDTVNTEHESPAMLSGIVELRGPEGSSQATLSDASEFVLDPVKAGVYTLTLQIDRLTVVLPDLQIGI
jgi:hypothetical protein